MVVFSVFVLCLVVYIESYRELTYVFQVNFTVSFHEDNKVASLIFTSCRLNN